MSVIIILNDLFLLSRGKKFMFKKPYSIGLDIGVSSVGWVCLTPQYEILKHQGRYAIGTREFTSAETAEERRLKRGTRRRYNRRIKRIQLLQQTLQPLFSDDPGFFIQHEEKEKHFWRNSNDFRNNSLSETLGYLGMNKRQYPTIYHLRHALMSINQKFHPRLIYLAIHHLTKFRGHFLNENKRWTVSQNATLQDNLRIYFSLLNEYAYEIDLADDRLTKIERILKNQMITSNDKRNKLKKLIGKDLHHPITLLVGLKTEPAKLFPKSDHISVYEEGSLSIHFSGGDYTEAHEKLTDEEKAIVDQAHIIYQTVNLFELLGNASCVSEAKVRDYDQFSEDLEFLKNIFNKYLGMDVYREFFITQRKHWTTFKQTHDKKVLSKFDRFLKDKKNYGETFYRDVEKQLEKLLNENSIKSEKDTEKIKKALNRLKTNRFLPKQRTYLNAAIPYQNNVYEAETILKKQQQFYPEITDEMIERVKQIISFRIPYYIGPLVKNDGQSEFGWLTRKKSDVPVLPWNMDVVVDRSSSAEKFIQRMTSYCMYLTDEKVLPKHSLLYQRFEVLNELNGLQIRSSYEEANRRHRLPKEVKQWILNEIFTKRKNVTLNYLKEALKKHDEYKYIIIDHNTDSMKEIHGTQKENAFGTSLSSYIDMSRIFGGIDETNIEMVEEIIYWITVFEDKQIVELKMKERYPEISSEQIKQVLNLKYAGWGRLSRKLLDGIPTDKSNNKTIIEIMEDESLVFMEVLSTEKYNLPERISELNRVSDYEMKKIKYEDIANLQGSPAIKKSIWQAILIVEELVDLFGEPEHIMIEFSREDQRNKVPNLSRKSQIEKLAREVSREEKALKKFLMEQSKHKEEAYRDQRLLLYITQGGKCMYSGTQLELARLHEYHIDHIYPRSFVHDNSIDNLALVKYEMNTLKGETKMPLEIIPETEKFKRKMCWRKLKENGLISEKKYFRLLKEEFTDQDKERFFARQLVETRQIIKHVKDLLEERFESTKIHTVNASIVAKLRSHTNVRKIRELNNKHHAIDAALTATIIQFIINEYGHNFLDFSFKYQHVQKKWRDSFVQFGKEFFLFSQLAKSKKFHHFKTGELITGNQYLHMLNDEIPWQTTKKIGTEEAAFYKETLHSPKQKTSPRYISSKLKHGVYDEMKTECTYLISFIEEDARGNIKKKSDFVDLYVIEKYQQRGISNADLAIYLAKKIARGKVLDAKIHTKIEKYQLIEINKNPFYFVSARELHNGKQLILPKNTLQKLYRALDMKENEGLEVKFLRETFNEIANVVNKQYGVFLPEENRNKILSYHDEINDFDSFLNGINELFKTTSASAARSTRFGYRFSRVGERPPHKVKFIHQSITGLRRRKPKSFRHELWSL